jgi:hypothetical protein
MNAWLARAGRRAASTMRGASSFLGGVFVAVLLVPLLPDIAIELFGGDSPPWLNPVLRVSSVALTVVVVVIVYLVRERARIRAARSVTSLRGLSQADVLVLPLSPERGKPTYTSQERRKDDPTAPELLIDTVQPDMVVAVLTPQFDDTALRRLEEELDGEGIALAVVRIDDAGDPSVAVPQTSSRLQELVGKHELEASSIYVDVTGGTKTMTLAMARAASLINADCVYVGSQHTATGGPLPGSQRPYRFDPAQLLAPGS